MPNLLIDADSLLYRAAFSAQRTRYQLWDEAGNLVGDFDKSGMNSYLTELIDEKVIVEPYTDVSPEFVTTSRLKEICKGIESKFPSYKPIYFLTSGKNFRYDLFPEYKGNRVAEKPAHYKACFDRIANGPHDLHVGELLEADDLVRIHYKEGDVIAHIDKDLDQIAGIHYNYVKDATYRITEIEGLRNFYQQVLTGDTSDNIPGLDGIGPVKAKKALADCSTEQEMYKVCVELYTKKGVSIDEMYRNCTLLYLLKSEDDVWQPPILTS